MVVSNGGSSCLGERNSATPILPQFNTEFFSLNFILFRKFFYLLTSQFNFCFVTNLEDSNHGLETTVTDSWLQGGVPGFFNVRGFPLYFWVEDVPNIKISLGQPSGLTTKISGVQGRGGSNS